MGRRSGRPLETAGFVEEQRSLPALRCSSVPRVRWCAPTAARNRAGAEARSARRRLLDVRMRSGQRRAPNSSRRWTTPGFESCRPLQGRLGSRPRRHRHGCEVVCGGRGSGRRRVSGVLAGPARDGSPQPAERSEADRGGQPDRDGAVGEHGDERQIGVHAEGQQHADDAAADGAGDRDCVADLADEVSEHDDGERGRCAEGVQHGPQDGGIERPPGDGAEQARVGGAHERERNENGAWQNAPLWVYPQ